MNFITSAEHVSDEGLASAPARQSDEDCHDPLRHMILEGEIDEGRQARLRAPERDRRYISTFRT